MTIKRRKLDKRAGGLVDVSSLGLIGVPITAIEAPGDVVGALREHKPKNLACELITKPELFLPFKGIFFCLQSDLSFPTALEARSEKGEDFGRI